MQTYHRKSYEKQLTKRIMFFGFWIVFLVFLLIVVGPGLLIRFSVLIGTTKDSQKTQNTKDSSVLYPPSLDPMPSATNSAMITLHGTGQAGLNILLYQNGIQEGATIIPNDGVFMFSPIELSVGENVFTAKVSANGSESHESQTIHIAYKKQAPKLEVTNPSPDSKFSKDQNYASVEATTDPETEVTINDRKVIVGSDGTFIYPYKLSTGENTITITAIDSAGNHSVVSFKVTKES